MLYKLFKVILKTGKFKMKKKSSTVGNFAVVCLSQYLLVRMETVPLGLAGFQGSGQTWGNSEQHGNSETALTSAGARVK